MGEFKVLKVKLFHILQYENLQEFSRLYALSCSNIFNELSFRRLLQRWAGERFRSLRNRKATPEPIVIPYHLGHSLLVYGIPNERNNSIPLPKKSHKNLATITICKRTFYPNLLPTTPNVSWRISNTTFYHPTFNFDFLLR